MWVCVKLITDSIFSTITWNNKQISGIGAICQYKMTNIILQTTATITNNNNNNNESYQNIYMWEFVYLLEVAKYSY